MTLERLWAGWRQEYIVRATEEDSDDRSEDGCVFCRILAGDEAADDAYIVWRDDRVAAILNAYPYSPGHLLVMPVRHVSEIEDLSAEEGAAPVEHGRGRGGRGQGCLPSARAEPGRQPGPPRGRRDTGPLPPALRPPLGRRHQLHDHRRRHPGPARVASRQPGPGAGGVAGAGGG